VPLTGDASRCGSLALDAAVFVIEADGLDACLAGIARLRDERPGIALLAALADELDAASLLRLLESGIEHFVRLPSGIAELDARLSHLLSCRCGAPHVLPGDPRLKNLIGASAPFRRQVERLPLMAGCDAGVLVLGETGTGKELFAQAVHYLSPRADRPWVAVNCGAIPSELFEAELFGHVRGAFTSALAARPGLVREAEGGTLFLDEVDALPLNAQVKLLRFLQEKEYRPVGSSALLRADVRVIAASNCGLAARVAGGGFRQDLYFRLNVLSLALPSLRERREDIPPLALHFVGQYARQMRRRVDALSPAALRALLAHDWPGNVRELQHVMERAVLMCPDRVIGAEHVDMGRPVAGDLSFQAAKQSLIATFERGYIENLLQSTGGNITRAAAAARKNRRAFWQLIRKYRIDSSRFRLPL
jgi:two-component system response regulator GlrR